MNLNDIKNILKQAIIIKEKLIANDVVLNQMIELSSEVVKSLENQGKLILAGNGGSYADTIHIAGEFVSKFMFDRKPLPAIALGSNNAVLTAIGNDYGYDEIFCREFKALAKQDDVLLCLSTSGNSENIVKLIRLAQDYGMRIYCLTGDSESVIGSIMESRYLIRIPSCITARIQEAHITVCHIVCEIVEREYCSK